MSPCPQSFFAKLTDELTARFGGITTYTRAPATGLWTPTDESAPHRDDLVVFEVVADSLDRPWWRRYVKQVEILLGQQELHVRCWPDDML